MRRARAQGREARDRIGEGGEEAKKRKKPQKSCRRDVGNRGEKRRQESVGSVDVNPEDLEKRSEAGRKAQDAEGLSKNITGRESVSPLSLVIEGFRSKYHSSVSNNTPWEGQREWHRMTLIISKG